MPARAESRISRTYVTHLDDIARIFVEERELVAPTIRRVRGELELPLRHITLTRWQKRQKAEWVTALEAAREARQLARRAEGNLRGKKFLDWCRTTELGLRDRYEALSSDAEMTAKELEALKVSLEGRILRLADAARAEEKHLEEQQTRESLRDCAAFARKLVKALTECGLPPEGIKRLTQIAKDPGAFMRDELL